MGGNGTSSYTEGTDAVFTRTLSELKRRGCGLLVVGRDAGPATEQACDRLLGADGGETRRRLFVHTDASAGCDFLDAHGSTADASETAVVNYATPARSVAASPSIQSSPPGEFASDESGPREVEVDDESLAALGITVSDVIDEFEAASGGLAPSELRLCFDSLTPLLEANDDESVFRFLHVLVGRVRHVDGMGHFHLPADVDDVVVRTLAPVFDATVELRTRQGCPEQRWHLQESGVTTDWLSL